MRTESVITIGREFASGGRLIGERLANELDVPFYDKSIIALAAENNGIREEIIEEVEQKKPNNFLYSTHFTGYSMPLADKVFIAQTEVIKKAAEKGGCVIVGRCADYTLKNDPRCVNVFIHAPIEQRSIRAREVYKINEENIVSYIRKQDKMRASYYNFYTDKKWGQANGYHLSLDSAIGIDECVSFIKEFAAKFAKAER